MDWVVDNGVSTHATSRRGLFSTYETSDFGIVRMEIMGKLMSSEYDIFVSKLAMRLL